LPLINIFLSDNKLVGLPNEVTLVIDGKSLHFTLTKELRKPFIDLCTSCKAVICCRVSPIQKAEMVELVSCLYYCPNSC
jgi:magnesium-transporting ATPase (P-type)